MPFFSKRNSQPHYGDRIEFLTHVPRSLEPKEAIELCAEVMALLTPEERAPLLAIFTPAIPEPAE